MWEWFIPSIYGELRGLFLYYPHYMAINAMMIYLAYILVYLFSNVSKAIDGLYIFLAN